MTVPKDPGRTAAVYRLYDAAGTLLYIGSAYDPDHRCKAHHSKPWWPLVVRREDEPHGGRRSAYVAEMRAIASEAPRFNDFGTPSYATPQTAAVLGRAETNRACGRAQSLAWEVWRKVRSDALAEGLPLAAATDVAEEARFAAIEASGLFPDWVKRRRAVVE